MDRNFESEEHKGERPLYILLSPSSGKLFSHGGKPEELNVRVTSSTTGTTWSSMGITPSEGQ